MTETNRIYDVSESWKEKFNIFEKAGKFKRINYENYKSLSIKERRKIGFNILAFMFSYFYYFSKKMWHKAAFILGATCIFSGIMILIEASIDKDFPFIFYWIPPVGVVASIANYDYFKFITKKELMWNKFPKVFSSIVGAILFPLIGIIFLLATSGVFFSNFSNAFKSSYKSSFSSAFINNWKKGVISNCAKNASIELCTCIANKTASELSIKELQDIGYTIKYIKKNIAHQCR